MSRLLCSASTKCANAKSGIHAAAVIVADRDITHYAPLMRPSKGSITEAITQFEFPILESIGLTPEQSVYLEDYGHVQSADQVIALEMGLQQDKIKPGDLLVLAGAGTGYTWSAIAVRWG